MELFHSPKQMCWICGKPVDLKTCKTDEHGAAVHEQCYTAKTALKNGSDVRAKIMLKDSA